MPPGLPLLPDSTTGRLSLAEYHALLRSGQLSPADRLELLDGQLVPKMTILPPHATAVENVRELLREALPTGWHVRSQQPITLATSEPEPDVAVVRGHRHDYATRHPGAAEVALVVEVADSALAVDRGLKARLYAEAGIDIYWIVNLVDRQIEVHTSPTAQGYTQISLFSATQSIPLLLDGVPLDTLAVHEVLP